METFHFVSECKKDVYFERYMHLPNSTTVLTVNTKIVLLLATADRSQTHNKYQRQNKTVNYTCIYTIFGSNYVGYRRPGCYFENSIYNGVHACINGM